MRWGKNRDPGFEYPSDVRLDEFEQNGEIKDNVNKMRRTGREVDSAEAEEVEECEEIEIVQTRRSWWSYLLPHHYLH